MPRWIEVLPLPKPGRFFVLVNLLRASSILLALLQLFLTTGCAARTGQSNLLADKNGPKVIYVVNHGWHSGIVVERADLLDDWPGIQGFARFDYLEFGWGDAEYYPAENGTLWLGLKALFWPTPSVLHVAGVNGSVAGYFPKSAIVRIRLAENGFARLRQFIRNTFQLDDQGRAIRVGPGLYGEGEFYRARGKFYFPKMCNYWTVSALKEAGLSVTPLLAVTAGNALSQAARHGDLIQKQNSGDASSVIPRLNLVFDG